MRLLKNELNKPPMSNLDNKRVFKNTAFLYIRMLIVLAISVFTVRIALENLGVVDYGIYNVVGGLSASFIFFQSALTNATQRYLNFALGRNDFKHLGEVFNISLEIYSIIAITVLIFGGILGTWFVSNKLTIPPDKVTAAIVVLFSTLVSLSFTFIGAVFEAVIIAHEDMKIYAYLGLLDAFSKLIVAVVISIIPFDKLVVYSILLAFFSIIPKAILWVYCHNRYAETSIKPFWNKQLFIEIFSFSGWNMYGAGVWMINQQGINILLNIFFGPVVNAARGVAYQVTNVVNNFVSNFYTAIKPQIIKTYAAEEFDQFKQLIFNSSRLSSYLIWMFFLPIYLRIDYVLGLWLKDVPAYTPIFIRWVLAYMLVDTLNNPLWTAIQAVGKLKKTILYGSSFFLLAFPLSYIFLKIGYGAYIVYPILIAVRAIYLVIVFRILNLYIPLSGLEYCKTVLMPIIGVYIVSFGMMYYINSIFQENFISLILVCAISVIISGISILLLGISNEERSAVLNKLNYVLHTN